MLQGVKNLASNLASSVMSAWRGEDHAHAIAAGIYVGRKIAAMQRAGTFFPISLLSDTGETEVMRQTYRKMLSEPAIKAAIYSKLFAVASLDLSVQPAEDDPNGQGTASFVRHALLSCKGGTRKLIESIVLPGMLEGYSLSEKVWGEEQRGQYTGKVVLKDLLSIDSRDYRFQTNNFKAIVAVTGRLDQKDWPLSDFCHFAHLPLFENPFGQSDLRAANRQYLILQEAWKLWAIGLERYTLPYMVGKLPPGKSNDKTLKTAIEAAMKEAKSLGYVVAPDGSDIEAVTMAMGHGDAFEKAIYALRQDIFLGITGAFLQALEGTQTGARSIGEVHQTSAELLVWYLADCAAGVVNDQIIPQLIDWNFGGNVPYPKVSFGSVNDADLLPSLQVDQGLATMGLPLSRKAAYARYRREAPADPTDALSPPAIAPPMGGTADATPFRG